MSKLVMVIDGNEEILQLYDVLLKDEGYRVSLHTYWEQEEGVKLVKSIQPDLVITDLTVKSRYAAIQVVKQLSLDPLTQNIPVVICTTVPAMLIVEMIPKPLFQTIKVIQKPFNVDDLVGTIRTLLN